MNFHPKSQKQSQSKKPTQSKQTKQETFGSPKKQNPPKQDSTYFKGKNQTKQIPLSSDWNRVSGWYDQLVGEKGSDYQREIIFPGAMKLMKLVPGEVILDLACGQGVFCRELFQKRDHKIIGVDSSKDLINIARQRSSKEISFFAQDAKKISNLSLPQIDVIVCLLAIQNMDPLEEIFKECAKVLKPEGRFVLMMNHPCFRIPRQSHWGHDKAVQYRRIDRYMGDMKIPIITHPGKDPDLYTWTFHRPLQQYLQSLFKSGFLLDGFEEFISHRFTDSGSRAPAENRARMEIPLFLGLSVKKVK